MSATNVPTNGFIAPPGGVVPPAPQGPAVQAPPTQPQSVIPPAGDPPRLNGQVYQAPNQQPGWVQQPSQQEQKPAPQINSMESLVAALQGVLNQDPNAAKPATQEPAKGAERPEWLPESANTFDVSKLDDPVIRSMATMLQVAGKDLDLDRAVGRALAEGDPSLVDLTYIAEKGGENAKHLAEMAKALVSQVAAKSAAIEQEVFALAGGEAKWNAATAAFNEKAPSELKLVVKQMLNSHKHEYITAGAKLVNEFAKQSGLFPQQGAPLLNGVAGNGAANGLSAVEFKKALASLNPYDADHQDKKAELMARRVQGKAIGL